MKCVFDLLDLYLSINLQVIGRRQKLQSFIKFTVVMQEIKDILLKIMVKVDSNFSFSSLRLEKKKSKYYKDSESDRSASGKSKS